MKRVSVFLVTILGVYLCASFIAFDISPKNWGVDGRGAATVAALGLACLAAAFD